MFLWEYVIKLLMGNSDSLFIGLVIVVMGYYGWLLWNIQNKFRSIIYKWDNINQRLDQINDKVNNLEKILFRKVLEKITNNQNMIENIEADIADLNDDITKKENNILNEINEESTEIKEYIKLLLNWHRGSKEDINLEKVSTIDLVRHNVDENKNIDKDENNNDNDNEIKEIESSTNEDNKLKNGDNNNN